MTNQPCKTSAFIGSISTLLCHVPLGEECELDFNGCTGSSCAGGQICTDTPAADQVANPGLPAYTCTACGDGYTTQGDKCIGNKATILFIFLKDLF